MAKRTKKPPMRIVVSIVAVMLVAVVVPLSSAFADGMNGMIGDGERFLYRADTADKLNPGVPIIKVGDSSSIVPVRVYHKAADDSDKYDHPDVFTADDLGADLNRVVVQMTDDTYVAYGSSHISFVFDFGPDYIIDAGVTEVRFTVSSETDKVLKIRESKIAFVSSDGMNFNEVSMPVTITAEDETSGYYDGSDYIMNITSEPHTYSITFDQVDVLRASVDLGEYEKAIMKIALWNTGPDADESIRDGDIYGYMFEVYGTPVNGYAISNIFVGILGVGLIVGAVFATPWVGRGTFDDIRKRRSRRKSQRRR